MLTVWMVDGKTRVVLPQSQWAFSVRERLTQMGHQLVATNEPPHPCVRNKAEMKRVDELLTSTGL